MSKSQVISIIGEPIQTSTYSEKGLLKSSLSYPGGFGVSTQPSIIIDEKSDRVEWVTCEENYTIHEQWDAFAQQYYDK